jgi:hypothetical protein
VVVDFSVFVKELSLDVNPNRVVHLWLIQLLLYQVTKYPPKQQQQQKKLDSFILSSSY